MARALLLAAGGLLVGLLALVGPGGLAPAAAARAALGLLAAAGWGLAALGAGGALVARLAPDLARAEGSALHAAVAGLLLWGLGGLALAAVGLLSPVPLAVLGAALAAGWLARPPVRPPRPGAAGLAAVAVVVALGLVDALAPPVATDEIYQHLAIPARMLRAGGLVGGPLHPDGSRPLLLALPAAALLSTGGAAAVKLFHLGLTALLVAATADRARRWGGPLAECAVAVVLAGSWTLLDEAGLAANDLPAALAALAALDAALAGRAAALVVAAGAALSVKYTAAGPVAGAFLAAALPWRRRLPAAGAALLLVLPWWVRNVAEGLHPLFPYAGWGHEALRFQYLERYGAGRDLAAMLALPWNAVMTAETDSFRFLGRVSPALLVLLAALPLGGLARGRPRRLALAAAAAALAWAAGPHWLRHLLPGLPALALAGGVALQRLAASAPRARAPVVAALLAAALGGLPGNLGPAVERAADRLPAATGRQSRDDFYRAHLPSWPAVAWANAHLPRDARVALLFAWPSFLLERDTVLGSVEDHVPSRAWMLRHGERALAELRALGVTHVLVGRARFLRNSYPGLDEERMRAAFDAPVEELDRLLRREATLLFQEGPVRVYRLDSAPRGA